MVKAEATKAGSPEQQVSPPAMNEKGGGDDDDKDATAGWPWCLGTLR